MPRRPPAREPPPELDQDMTASDIATELRQLKFEQNEFSAIKIDKPVHDYLVNTLTRQRVSRRT